MTFQLFVAAAAAPLVAWVVVLCLRDPMRVALPLYAAVIPVSGVVELSTSKFASLSSIVGMLLGAGLVLHLVRRQPGHVRLSATIPMWILLLGVAGATVLWSVAAPTTASSFAILASLVGTYVLVALAPVDRDILRRLENGLLAGGLIAVTYGLYQLLVLGGFPSDPPVPGATDGRFGNDLLGPNNQAVAFILPLLVTLARSSTLPSRAARTAYSVMAALLLVGVLMTGSRGGILSTILAVVVLAAVTPRGRKKLVTYGVVGATVAAAVFIAHPLGLAERTVETTSSSGRTDIWRVGLAACPQYCAFGSGWGTFRTVYADTQATVADARVLAGAGNYEPHNLWLLVAIELGALGVVLLAAGLLLSLREALRLPVGLRGAPLAGLVATVFAAFFLSNLEFKFFWMALMLIAISRNLADQEAAARQRQDLAGTAVAGSERR